jgi:hypothetical protein
MMIARDEQEANDLESLRVQIQRDCASLRDCQQKLDNARNDLRNV